MKKKAVKVLVVMGSDSDLPVMLEAEKALAFFGVPCQTAIASAHRSPGYLERVITRAEKAGAEIIIAGAGGAAHLAGVIASKTVLPVIGVPLNSTALNGLDALLATVQMPGGVPVAAMAIGRAGAWNAGVLAARILAAKDRKMGGLLRAYKRKLSSDVRKKAGALKKKTL